MAELKFIKQKKSQGIYEETGYYLDDEFLDRYKRKAIEILRARIIKAGNGNFQDGKDKAPKEWAVVHNEFLKSVEAVKKTNETKKPYWDEIHKRTLQRKINRLNEKIEWVEKRKQDMVDDYNKRIEKIKSEINLIKERIDKNGKD